MAWYKYMYASPRSSPPTCCVTCVIFYIALHNALVLNACKSVAWCFPFYNFALSILQCNAMWYYGSAINLQSIMCNEVRKCKASQIIDNRKEQVRRNPVKRLGRWRLGFKQQLLPPSRTRKKLRKNKI